jgi:LmeA-like phospholipid-binding
LPLRKILFSAVILLALVLAFEVGVTVLSERGLQKALETQYGMPGSLKVSINSFPLTLSLIRNHIGQLKLTWEGQTVVTNLDAQESGLTYYGQVNLYDVELDMPALIRTRIEIRQISHIDASIIFDEQALNASFNLPDGSLVIDQNKIYLKNSNPQIQYKLKVSNGNSISLDPSSGSIGDSDSFQNPQSGVEPDFATVALGKLPMEARPQSASVEANRVIIAVSIPIWEAYIKL